MIVLEGGFKHVLYLYVYNNIILNVCYTIIYKKNVTFYYDRIDEACISMTSFNTFNGRLNTE